MFRITSSRPAAALAVALGTAALVPAGASASTTWFGSSLNHEPANAGSTCADNGVLGSPLCTHVGSFYPGTSGRTKAPVSGTITKVKVRAQGPTKLTFRLVKVRHVAKNHRSGQAEAVARGRTVSVKGPSQDQLDNGIYPVETFRTKLKVRKGQELAVDTRSNTAEYCSDGTPGQLLFSPTLKVGGGFHASKGVDDCLMLVQAVVKH